MSDITTVVEELVQKAKGYTAGKGSGKEAEAVDHSIMTNAPKADEKEKETNKANSGTHPEKGGSAGSSDRHEGGDDFKDGSEDTIGGEGKASPGRPGTIKHEHEEEGPNHPGTASDKQKQQKSEKDGDLKKGQEEDDDDDDEDEDSEKSQSSDEVFLDIDQFAKDITAEAVKKAKEELIEEFADALNKSNEYDFVAAGLAKSINSTIERIEEVEKAIGNIARALNVRKSLVRASDNIHGVNNSSLEHRELSKGEISSMLFDMRTAGDSHVTDQMILKYDATGDLEVLPKIVKSKLGID